MLLKMLIPGTVIVHKHTSQRCLFMLRCTLDDGRDGYYFLKVGQNQFFYLVHDDLLELFDVETAPTIFELPPSVELEKLLRANSTFPRHIYPGQYVWVRKLDFSVWVLKRVVNRKENQVFFQDESLTDTDAIFVLAKG